MSDRCILQVEDEEADIFLLQHVFQQAGLTVPVHAVSDGQMAIDYLAGTECFCDRDKYPLPCLVLLDLNLPKKNGFEVLDWLRHQPGLRRLVVIAFSASAFQKDVDRAYDLGVTCYIQKPSELELAIEMAKSLKGWWMGLNHFATVIMPGETPAGTSASTQGRW